MTIQNPAVRALTTKLHQTHRRAEAIERAILSLEHEEAHHEDLAATPKPHLVLVAGARLSDRPATPHPSGPMGPVLDALYRSAASQDVDASRADYDQGISFLFIKGSNNQ